MARLLIVHHTPSPATHTLLEAVRDGATNSDIGGVEVAVRPALTASSVEALEADGYVLGAPANLGYMAGALKHFFDQIYYPCLDATAQRPFGFWLHGNNDVTGARRGIETITTGLKWRLAQEPVEVIGEPSREDIDRCWELGAAVAATLMD